MAKVLKLSMISTELKFLKDFLTGFLASAELKFLKDFALASAELKFLKEFLMDFALALTEKSFSR